MRQTLIALHVLAAVVWIGGMFFAQFCLRPAAVETLEPPRRLPLLAAALGRFFGHVSVAVLVLFATGLVLLLEVGFARAPIGWHAMAGIAVVMAVLFAVIRGRLYPRLRAHIAASDWPAAAGVLGRIRGLVSINLALGVLAVVAAFSAR